jgi:alpha-1,3-rhamnosyl/mannosyltransferase
VVTISEFTAAALRERFDLDPAKIRVTPLGLSRPFLEDEAPDGSGAARRALGLPGEFLLFVGATEARKNLPRLIEALSIVHRSYRPVPLVLVGREGGDHARVRAEVAARGLADWVRMPGYLPELQVRDLYRTATAFVFPSYCEGFGLPLLEAMASGLPSAVSGVSALPEVGGDAAVYYPPDDAKEMAAQIVRLLSDAGLRESLRARGRERARRFTWEKTAAATLAFYREVLGRP